MEESLGNYIKCLEGDNTILKAENEHLRKQNDTLRSLVDGAYEIVELYSVLPGQEALEKWKADWLAKARGFGCGGE